MIHRNCFTIILIYLITKKCFTEETKLENMFKNLTTTTIKPINHTKEFVLCEINEKSGSIESNCDNNAFNFTFYAFFTLNRPKRSANFKNLNQLVSILSESSVCEVMYMKVIKKFIYMNFFSFFNFLVYPTHKLSTPQR